MQNIMTRMAVYKFVIQQRFIFSHKITDYVPNSKQGFGFVDIG